MIKIKFNTTTSNFILILMITLFTIAFAFMFYHMIANNIYNSSTIFPLILLGYFDAIFILSIFESDNFVQELQINENYAIFNYRTKRKNQVKSIKLKDIENFHVDIDIKRYRRSSIYYANFSIKIKNSDDIQTFWTYDNYCPKGICSLFDIQEMIPNFTYNITSNDEKFKNSLSYYAENKKISDDDIKIQKKLTKVIIILLVVASMILIPMIYSIVKDFISMQ